MTKLANTVICSPGFEGGPDFDRVLDLDLLLLRFLEASLSNFSSSNFQIVDRPMLDSGDGFCYWSER